MKTKLNPSIICQLSKPAFLLTTFLFLAGGMLSQQVYDDFEGNRALKYGERFGVLDSMAKNPSVDAVNGSAHCGYYVRNSQKRFANIKMNLPGKLTGVEAYATYLGEPPKLKLKVYTTAPVGTLVEILIGAKRGNNDYPAGTHSQYQAYTTVSNAWEELSFKFSQIPQGSETAANQIDQVVLLFNPNSATSDAYYFDDLTGPPIGGYEKTSGKNNPAPEKLNKKNKGTTSKKADGDKKAK